MNLALQLIIRRWLVSFGINALLGRYYSIDLTFRPWPKYWWMFYLINDEYMWRMCIHCAFVELHLYRTKR